MGDRLVRRVGSVRLAGFSTTVFAETTQLATSLHAINLGQGFPDYKGPDAVLDEAVDAIARGLNQYPPATGVPELKKAICEHERRFYGRELDADSEVLVTTGATEAVAAAVLGLCDPGDEVVTFEPFYDSYAASVAIGGARLRAVRLHPPSWELDPAELEAAITKRTRVVLLNSPHNPTGKVFSPAELGEVARVCVEHDLVAITDEVYEHLVFDGTHRPLSTFEDMAERTLKISSAAKTFSVTGWKIGWACGPARLLTPVRAVKQFLTYASGTPFQYGVARGLGLPDDYFEGAAEELRGRRDLLCGGLSSAGLDVLPAPATYFAMVDVRSAGYEDASSFCRDLLTKNRVAAIPVAAFHLDPTEPQPYARFAFCKTEAVLEEAIERLLKGAGRIG